MAYADGSLRADREMALKAVQQLLRLSFRSWFNFVFIYIYITYICVCVCVVPDSFIYGVIQGLHEFVLVLYLWV